MKKYLAALLPGFIILFGGLQTALADDRIDAVEGGQMIALTAGVLITFVVPIVDGRWAGLLKTGAAMVAAVATLIIPLILGFSWQALVIVALAALSALATEIGVQVRRDVNVPEAIANDSTVAVAAAAAASDIHIHGVRSTGKGVDFTNPHDPARYRDPGAHNE